MASAFIGYNVYITLKVPFNTKILGEVADVVGQRLFLRNGMACALLSIFVFFFFSF